MKDLAYLQRKEFRLHGGQISDTTSDITYNSICKQIDEGLQEKHPEGEIIRGVLHTIKPGNFRDMLTNKDDFTVTELKSFCVTQQMSFNKTMNSHNSSGVAVLTLQLC